MVHDHVGDGRGGCTYAELNEPDLIWTLTVMMVEIINQINGVEMN